MTSTRPLTASERYARFVLAAWNNDAFGELQAILKQSPLAGPEATLAPERERMELIQDLGRSLLAWQVTGKRQNTPNLDVAVALVRHLARCDEGSAEADVLSRTSLPLEMPASFPHSRYVQ